MVKLVVGEVISQVEKDSGFVLLLRRVDHVGHVIAAAGSSFKLVVHVVSR